MKKGFTLIEMVLYLAIAGTVLYFVSGFAFNSIFGKSTIETYHDLDQNGNAILDEIVDNINNAEAINGIY